MTPHQLPCPVPAAASAGYSGDTESTEVGGCGPRPPHQAESSLESPDGATELIQKAVLWLTPRSALTTPSTFLVW